MDKIFANNVLNALVDKGNSIDDIHARLGALDADQQKQFISQAAEKLGMTNQESKGPSILESAARQGAKGVSLGFSDEAAGVGSALAEAVHGDGPLLDRIKRGYVSGREDERKNFIEDEATNPITSLVSNIAGGALPAIATGGSGVAIMGGLQGLGSSNADLTKGDVFNAAKDTATGAITAKALDTLFKIAPSIGKKFGAGADELAEKATGATGKFAEKNFKPGTGKYLRENKIVRPFDSPAKVAERAQGGLDEAGKLIDKAVMSMDESGEVITKEGIINKLKATINEMRSDPSKAPTIRQLESKIDDIRTAPGTIVDDLEHGGEVMLPSSAENIKRGYYDDITNFTDPEKQRALKSAASAYKTSVDETAEKTSPEVAKMFAKGKSDWGMLAPVEQAATGRASQLSQSPIGGLLDTTAAVAGEVAKGGAGIPAAIVRRAIAPRVSSTVMGVMEIGEKAFNAAGNLPPVIKNILSRLPITTSEQKKPENQNIPIKRMGKFSSALESAQQRGPQALAATNYVLGQSSPEYREMLKQQTEEFA